MPRAAARGSRRRGSPVGRPSGRARLAQPGPVDLGLDVADTVAVELDLDLVMLDVPAVHGRQPPEPPTAVRNHAPSAVDQRAAPRRAEPLAFLGIGPAEIEDLRVRRLPGRDARERLSGNDGPGFALGRRAAWRSDLDAPLQSRAERLDEHRDQWAREVAEDEEERREEQRR